VFTLIHSVTLSPHLIEWRVHESNVDLFATG